MNKNLADFAADLLQRPLLPGDGLHMAAIEMVEKSPGISLPEPLKEFYRLVGSHPLFMHSFQHFSSPSELLLKDDKLIFLRENQDVCYWSVGINNSELPVYQTTDPDSNEWFEEEINLNDFLALMLYYQYIHANNTRQQTISVTHLTTGLEKQQFLNERFPGFTKVASHNGLVIYDHPQKLLWYFTDEAGEISEELHEITKQPL